MNLVVNPLSPSLLAFDFLPTAIKTFLEDHKIFDTVLVDLKGKTSFAATMIIASGRSRKHISSAAELLRDHLKGKQSLKVAIEGLNTSDWVLIDAGEVIVHLFKPETRSIYNLEKMWGEYS